MQSMPTSPLCPTPRQANAVRTMIGCGFLLVALAGCSQSTTPDETSPAVTPRPSPDSGSASVGHPLFGVWEFESARYDEVSDLAPADPAVGKLKFIGETRFMWVEYDRASGAIRTAAGGQCEVDGTNLTETIDFFGPGMEGFKGQAMQFTEELRGYRLYHRGQIPDGPWIEEVWKRFGAEDPPQ